MSEIPTKRYLGDAVYVRHDGFGIVLTTENGIEETNKIFLEPSVIEALEGYIADVKKAYRNESEEKPEIRCPWDRAHLTGEGLCSRHISDPKNPACGSSPGPDGR